MNDFTKLELSTETIRELTEDELAQVNGGAKLTGTATFTPTDLLPSGGPFWTGACNVDTLGC